VRERLFLVKFGKFQIIIKQKNFMHAIKIIPGFFTALAMRALDSAVAFAAFPRAHAGLAKLRPQHPSFQNSPSKPPRD
jgi:hypothetical protein